MGLSKTSPETLSLILQIGKQEMAVMFKLKIIFKLLGMGTRLRVETGQMEGDITQLEDGINTVAIESDQGNE